MELEVRTDLNRSHKLPKLVDVSARIGMNYYIKKKAVEKIWGFNVNLEKIDKSRHETVLLKAMAKERVKTNWWLDISSSDDLFPEPGEEYLKLEGEIHFTFGPCRLFINPDSFDQDVKIIMEVGHVRPWACWRKYSYYERHLEYYRSHNLPVEELIAMDKPRIASIPIEGITEALSKNTTNLKKCNRWFFQYIARCMQLQNIQLENT